MTTKTFRLSGNDIERRWRVLDAAGRPLGRLASEAAQLLLGKHKATYEPHLTMGDYVIVVNASKVELTGQKTRDKVYYRHSGYPGALRERSYLEQMERDPAKVIEKAIKGMLPHNVRGRELFRHLKVYAGAEHPHDAQLRAGTGDRARKSAAKAAAAPQPAEQPRPAAVEAEAPVPAEATAAPAVGDALTDASARLDGALSRYRRDELDAEATRLGIEIDPAWNKPDVVEAIERVYAEHPVRE